MKKKQAYNVEKNEKGPVIYRFPFSKKNTDFLSIFWRRVITVSFAFCLDKWSMSDHTVVNLLF
eukprot:UN28446